MTHLQESPAGRFWMVLVFILMVGILGGRPVSAQTVVRDWVAVHNGPGQSRDTARDVVVDGAGNVYVTGDSESLLEGPRYSGEDFTTVKLDPDGNLLWAARFNGVEDYDDMAMTIALDSTGNVIVSGNSYGGTDTYDDFTTVKYDSEGNELWVAHYDGPGHGYDRVKKVVTDAAGNVYVKGSSQLAPGAEYECVTIKYDPSGNEIWIDRSCWSADLAVDALGNVHMTGSRAGDGLPTEIVTVKYDTDGDEVWVAIHTDATARAMALDTAGNVYVLGEESLGTYVTVKYDEDGNELWSDRYVWPDAYSVSTKPKAIAVDGAGNVHVTGNVARYDYSHDDYYIGTIKYDSEGNKLWAVEYSGSSYYENDQAVSLALDGSGNIYIAGSGVRYQNLNDTGTYNGHASSHFLLIKYSPGGTLLAENNYNGTASGWDRASGIGMDAAGNVYVAGTSMGAGLDHLEDFAVVKYDSDGNELWVTRYQGQGNGVESLDRVSSAQSDGAGNVLVTGSWAGHGFVTMKHAPSGALLWEAHYQGSVDEHHPNSELAVDASGNAYVAFSTCGTGPGYDYVTIKYDTDGNEQWVARFDEASDQDDWISALAVDSSSNVYVTGKSDYHPDYDLKEFATVKYDPDGNELWEARYRSPLGASFTGATALALDGAGNAYVTGTSYAGNTGTGRDYATIKYDTSGNELWVAHYDGPGGDTDEPTAIGIDSSGNVFVTGGSVGGGNQYKDYATVKYDPDGNELWVARYDGSAEEEDVTLDLLVDPSGNAYVTGYSTDSLTGVDFATFKYGPDGSVRWFHRWSHVLSMWDGAHALALDGSGHLYVTGKSRGFGVLADPYYDEVTIKYDLNGNPIWTTRYNRADGYESGDCITLDALNNVYVGGSSFGGEDPDLDFVLIRYSQHEDQPWGAASVASARTVDSASGTHAWSSRFGLLGILATPFLCVLLMRRFLRRDLCRR